MSCVMHSGHSVPCLTEMHQCFLLSRQQGRSETEEYSSDSESESEDEEELQMILEDLQKQNEELEVRETPRSHWLLNIKL